MNPAGVLSEFIKGNIQFQHIFQLILSEIIGGFVGQSLVLLTFWPHYREVPNIEQYSSSNQLNEIIECDDKGSTIQQNFRLKEEVNAQYIAALKEDQASKLSTCSVTAAIDEPVYNFLCEFICTFMLIFGSSFISENFNVNADPLISFQYSKGIQFK